MGFFFNRRCKACVPRAATFFVIESLRILRNRYQSGLATMTDVLAAESARAAARTAMADAVYRQHIGIGRLEYAAGILSPTSPAMKP